MAEVVALLDGTDIKVFWDLSDVGTWAPRREKTMDTVPFVQNYDDDLKSIMAWPYGEYAGTLAAEAAPGVTGPMGDSAGYKVTIDLTQVFKL